MRQIIYTSLYNVLVVLCGLCDSYSQCIDVGSVHMSHSLLAELHSLRPLTDVLMETAPKPVLSSGFMQP